MQKATNKLYNQVAVVAKQTVIAALETCDVDHDNAYVRSALKSALYGSLVSATDNTSKIWELFKKGVFQLASAPRRLNMIAATMVKRATVMEPGVKFSAETLHIENR